VGSSLARLLSEAGGKVVAIADARGATFNEGGIDVPALMGHVYSGGSLWEYSGGTPLPSDPGESWMDGRARGWGGWAAEVLLVAGECG